MDDSTSQSQDLDPSSATPVQNSILILPRTGPTDDLQNISLPEHDDYFSNDFQHIHLLQTNTHLDPILNHHNTTSVNQDFHHHPPPPPHGQVLQYFADTSNDRSRYLKRSKAIRTPSNYSSSSAFDPNGDMNFLYDLATPTSVNRQLFSSQMDHSNYHGRLLTSQSEAPKLEQQNILR